MVRVQRIKYLKRFLQAIREFPPQFNHFKIHAHSANSREVHKAQKGSPLCASFEILNCSAKTCTDGEKLQDLNTLRSSIIALKSENLQIISKCFMKV